MLHNKANRNASRLLRSQLASHLRRWYGHSIFSVSELVRKLDLVSGKIKEIVLS